MATIRNAMRFGGRPASCSALVLTLAALVGLPSPGEARPFSRADVDCIAKDVACTDKCDTLGVFEKLCYARCDALLKACFARIPSGPPDVHVAGGGNKAFPVNTRFPGGTPPSGGPPRANINAGANNQTFVGSPSPAAGYTPVTSAAPGSNAIGTSSAISATGAISSSGAFGTSGVRKR